jgi:hypothetical protein
VSFGGRGIDFECLERGSFRSREDLTRTRNIETRQGRAGVRYADMRQREIRVLSNGPFKIFKTLPDTVVCQTAQMKATG